MKRMCHILKLAILLLSLPALALAAGTVTQSTTCDGQLRQCTLTFSWTGDASNGTVPATATSTENTGFIKGMYLYLVETDPGSTAPTTLYDITLVDLNSLDVMGGTLANRSATVTENAMPLQLNAFLVVPGAP